MIGALADVGLGMCMTYAIEFSIRFPVLRYSKPVPAPLTASRGLGTLRRCDSRLLAQFQESRRSQRRLEFARLLDCEGSMGAVAGESARESLGRKEFKIKHLL